MASSSTYWRAIAMALTAWLTEPAPMAVSSTRAPSRVQLAIAPASDLHVEAGAADQSAREPIARVLNSSSSRAKILQTSSWRARALWIRLIANLEDAPLLPSDAWSACALGQPHAYGGEILVPREVHEFRVPAREWE